MTEPIAASATNGPNAAEAHARAMQGKGYWRDVGERLRADKATLVVIGLLSFIVLAAIFAPWIVPHDPYDGSVIRRLKPVGHPGYWLGTDELGRDLLSRMIYGGRLSLLTGIMPVMLALLIGGSLGVIAGYRGGRTNMLIMRTMDIFYAFPSILLAVAVLGALGPGIANAILALSLTFIPPITRIAESVTTQMRGFDFVEAARASGAGSFTIIRYHVLNNVVGPIMIFAASLISVSIILASGLSFIGLGVSPPAAEWGLMLNNLRSAIWVDPVIAALPGVMIFITSMCFNLMSDGVRGAMDVRV